MTMENYLNEMVKADEVRREKEELCELTAKQVSNWVNLVFWVVTELIVILRMI